MKNLAKIFMAVVLLAGVTSCVQDTTVDEGSGFNPTTTFTVSVDDTRTHLGEKDGEAYPVYWSVGDKLSVNGIESAPLAEVAEGSVKGLFQISGLVDGPYKASYPATAEAGKVLFAAQQSYKEGTFSEGAAVMYGESDNMTIAMQHASGVLQFPIKAAEGEVVALKKVIVTNVNGKLAGLYTAELIEGELALAADATATSSISYDCGELELSAEPVKLHIAVPAGEYAELKVSLLSTDNQVMNFKVAATGDKAIKPGFVREFNKNNGIVFSGNDATFQLTDSESLMEFAKLCAEGGFAYGKAKVMNDFTFDSATYTWVPVEGFVYGIEFDGGDFTITGLTDCLFGKANAYIHNLTLNSTVERAAHESDGVGLFAGIFEGTIANCTAKGSLVVNGSGTSGYNGFAGVVGEVTGTTTFENVVNEAPVTVDGVNNTRNGVAGILGGTQGNGSLPECVLTFTNCHNKADITSTVNGEKKRRNMGGIIGYSEGDHTIAIDGCSNSGDILNETIIEDLHMGGLIGTNMCPATSIANSWNTGSVTCAGNQIATGNNYSLGGLVGYQTGSTTITKCANGATIAEGVMTKLATPNVITIGNAPGGVALGGLVGYFSSTWADYTYSVSECKNYGSVITTKDCGKADNGYEARAGGIIGYINIAGKMTVSKCHNYGFIERDATEVTADAEGALWNSKGDCGGIVCRVTSSATTLLTNSIIIEECVNEKEAVISYKGAKRGEVNNGGIMGCSGGNDIIRNCQNYGTITSSGTMNSTMSLGGILGNISNKTTVVDNCTNYGKVEQTVAASVADRLLMGGIVGYAYSAGTIQNSINETAASIYIAPSETYSVTSYIAVGGICGYARGADTNVAGLVYKCTNKANLTFDGYSKKAYSAGGVIGLAAMAAKELTNEGALTFGGKSTTDYRAGGVIGQTEQVQETSDLTNSGALTFGGTATTTYWAGGVIGYSMTDVTTLTNSGAVTFTGTATTGFYIGGVAGGLVGANASVLKNSGVVTYSGTLTTGVAHAKSIYQAATPSIGGVVGRLGADSADICTVDDLQNNASIVLLPGSGTSKSDSWTFGGVVGVSTNYCIKNAKFLKNAKGVAPSINITTYPFVNGTGSAGTNAIQLIAGVVAGLRADKAGADVDGCQNQGTILLNSTVNQDKTNISFGGIVARSTTGANGVIKNCTNEGSITFGSNHRASKKSMDAGGIASSVNCKIEKCINRGTITFQNLSTTANYDSGNVFYSAGIGGIAGVSSNQIVECEDYGSIIAEANSLNPRPKSSWYRFGGIVGSASAGCYIDSCIAKGKIEIDAASAMSDNIFYGGGVVAYIAGASPAAYIVKDCTIEATVSMPALTKVGLVMGNPYTDIATKYTPVAETDYPVMGCKVDGSFTRSGKELGDVTESNFHEVIYSDVPSVETWVPVVGEDGITRYHGNYGVKTEGGESGDDL